MENYYTNLLLMFSAVKIEFADGLNSTCDFRIKYYPLRANQIGLRIGTKQGCLLLLQSFCDYPLVSGDIPSPFYHCVFFPDGTFVFLPCQITLSIYKGFWLDSVLFQLVRVGMSINSISSPAKINKWNHVMGL